jgi:hypothetical protein
MSEHTEGPWMMDKGHMIIGGNGMRVAYADLMSDADEALVIAAPDLLSALEAMNAQLEADGYMGTTYGPLRYAAMAAIAKAKGESK